MQEEYYKLISSAVFFTLGFGFGLTVYGVVINKKTVNKNEKDLKEIDNEE